MNICSFPSMSWPASEPAVHFTRGNMDGRVKLGHDGVWK